MTEVVGAAEPAPTPGLPQNLARAEGHARTRSGSKSLAPGRYPVAAGKLDRGARHAAREDE